MAAQVASRVSASNNARNQFEGRHAQPRIFCISHCSCLRRRMRRRQDEFTALLDEAWECALAKNPDVRLALGDRRYNDQWPDRSLERDQAPHQDNARVSAAHYAIDNAALSETTSSTTSCFAAAAEASRCASVQGYLLPFSHRGGVQNLETDSQISAFRTVRTTTTGWLAWTSRRIIEQTIALAEEGRKQAICRRRV